MFARHWRATLLALTSINLVCVWLGATTLPDPVLDVAAARPHGLPMELLHDPVPRAASGVPAASPDGPAVVVNSAAAGEFMDVAWAPPYVFVTGGRARLLAYRLTLPDDTHGTVNLTPIAGSLVSGHATRILVVDSHTVAVTGEERGLFVYGVDDMSHPVQRAHVVRPMTAFGGMALHRGKLLVTNNVTGLKVYDGATSLNPLFELPQLPGACDVAVDGDCAIVARGASGVSLLDLKGKPRVMAHIATSGEAKRVVIYGDKAYVALGYRGIDVIDLASAKRVGHLDSMTPVFALAAANRRLVAAAWARLAMWSLPTDREPQSISQKRLLSSARTPLMTGVALRDRWMVTTEWSSLQVTLLPKDPDPVDGIAQVDAYPAVKVPAALSPDFVLQRIDGPPLRLGDWRGHPVLLAFFSYF